MLDSSESTTYGGKGSVLEPQWCVPLPFLYAKQSAAPMIASSQSPLDRGTECPLFSSTSRFLSSDKNTADNPSVCIKTSVQTGLGKELAGSGKRAEALLDSLGRYEKGLPIMSKLFSAGAAFLSLAITPVVGIAQTDSTQITITPTNSQKVIAGAPDRFTGSVRVQSLFDGKEPSRSSGGEVTFQPGARSAWHTHPLGQILIVTDGVGWVQQWGGPVQVIRKGDVVWIPAGVKHWHGATPTTTMTHIAFQEQLDGRAVDWLEKVTDEQYRLMK